MIGSDVIRGLRLRTPLVVMSGCKSGAGEVTPGEGLLGVTRAWQQAGARAVAATLWATPDHAGELWESFYKHLAGVPPAAWPDSAGRCLQQAQLEMLRSDSWRSRPSYWASYFLTGS